MSRHETIGLCTEKLSMPCFQEKPLSFRLYRTVPHQLTFRHRAGVTPYTSSIELAECCVFNKQSQPPGHCDHHPLRKQVPSQTAAYLLPKLRYYFAEFLHPSSLKRLSILYLTTCVGLGYGSHNHTLRRFSWKQGINYFFPLGNRLVSQAYVSPDLPKLTPYTLSHGQPTPC